MTVLIAIALVISTLALAFVLYRLFGRRARGPAEGEIAGKISTLKSALHFMLGPFPLSVAIHVVALLLLIAYVHPPRGRELIMVNLESG